MFNCSLKVNEQSSLNEAAYPGTDLMADMVGLLNYFRTNQFCMQSDIIKAFLMIRLKLEKDKNRFSFILYKDGKYVPYRYNTIIFGFCSSPFILNYIIQYHAGQCQIPHIREAIKNHLYVDNYYQTSSDPEVLKDHYQLVKTELERGGFILRDWSSNSKEVLEAIPIAEQGDLDTKVLGYEYNAQEDTLAVRNTCYDASSSTKRQVLSSTSSVFDPIGI